VVSRAVRRICVDLSDYLADFLDELAKLLSKENPIYEAWKAGREANLRT